MIKKDKHFFEKYSRQMIMDQVGIEGQDKIIKSEICVIGCGGLGTSVAQYLSMSGISNFNLVDFDSVVISNLNRQTLFTEKDIGKKKSKVLSKKIKEINSLAEVNYFDEKVTSKNIHNFINKKAIVLDCTDNFESRLLINKYCHDHKKILVSAAIQNFDIQAFMLASWLENDNPCYKCIFPELTNDNEASCDEMGIISSVAGLAGLLQANLTINYILGLKTSFKEFILLDCINLDMKKISIKKNRQCKICN